MRKKKKKYSFRRKHKRVKKTTKTVTFNGIQLKLLRYENMWVFPEIRTYMYGAGCSPGRRLGGGRVPL